MGPIPLRLYQDIEYPLLRKCLHKRLSESYLIFHQGLGSFLNELFSGDQIFHRILYAAYIQVLIYCTL